MNYIFHELIGKIMEIYIDDVAVKSKGYREHLADLCRALECTRKHGLKMNPNKCAFGVSAGQFLGFMVHERGIEGPKRRTEGGGVNGSRLKFIAIGKIGLDLKYNPNPRVLGTVWS